MSRTSAITHDQLVNALAALRANRGRGNAASIAQELVQPLALASIALELHRIRELFEEDETAEPGNGLGPNAGGLFRSTAERLNAIGVEDHGQL